MQSIAMAQPNLREMIRDNILNEFETKKMEKDRSCVGNDMHFIGLNSNISILKPLPF